MRQALADGTHLLIEATSNQVNQAGGYTGMTPAMFRDYTYSIAAETGFDCSRLILGGDHLGPNPWQHLDSATAMDNALEMLRLFAEAGFTKIHLDASMRCANDPEVLPDAVMASRAAAMCAAAESARKRLGLPAIVYVIGTEVPTPGGATHSLDGLAVTTCEAAEQTLAVHREAFHTIGLDEAWERVIALVVQPGVEFDHDSVVDFNPAKAAHLQRLLEKHPGLVMEAHSTDYQKPHAYQQLVGDGFAILKVGPALTFALRETLYALAAIERELLPDAEQSHLRETMEATMLAHPANWKKYYPGTPEEQALLRVYSYSDRLRYYWKFAGVEAATAKLIDNLRRVAIPDTVLSQHCPLQYAKVRSGAIKSDPKELVIAGITQVLAVYSAACFEAAT